MLNNVVLMGRLVADPELRKTPNDISTSRFTLAVDRGYVKAGTERQADFIDCVAWRQTAEFICQYFRKGSMLAVTGSIQTRNYEDKSGNKRKSVEVVIDEASFCGEKRDSSQNYGGNAPATYAAPAYQQDAAAFSNADNNGFEEIGDDEDLPF